jgi:hypothetical protein
MEFFTVEVTCDTTRGPADLRTSLYICAYTLVPVVPVVSVPKCCHLSKLQIPPKSTTVLYIPKVGAAGALHNKRRLVALEDSCSWILIDRVFRVDLYKLHCSAKVTAVTQHGVDSVHQRFIFCNHCSCRSHVIAARWCCPQLRWRIPHSHPYIVWAARNNRNYSVTRSICSFAIGRFEWHIHHTLSW